MDDLVADLFRQVAQEKIDTGMFYFGYKSVEFIGGNTRPKYVPDPNGRFITRHPLYGKHFPSIQDIPAIIGPSADGLVEIMRGCGIGCDFCEVTMRQLRYYPPERVADEIKVNLSWGINNAWLHSDNLWAYQLDNNDYQPNREALIELARTVMSLPGVARLNPTHATVAPAAADPELVSEISRILRAGPTNHIGVQVGLETGSDRLAKEHMRNKALPLRIGTDGTWAEIVEAGQKVYDASYWIPAYTVIVGQENETDEDNWDTVNLVNRMSAKRYRFTVTPMAFVNLGLLRSKGRYDIYEELTPSQAAVIYACWRNTKRMADQFAWKVGRDDPIKRFLTSSLLIGGASIWLHLLERYLRKLGPEYRHAVEKSKVRTAESRTIRGSLS